MLQAIPFDWQLRLSKRAKRPRITISSRGKVELVWPHRLSQRHVPHMLHEHTAWVLKQLDALPKQKQQNIKPPHVIALLGIKQTYDVHYSDVKGRFQLAEYDASLTLSGDLRDREALRQTLMKWVKNKGHEHLKPWLANVAQEMGVAYQQVSIRLQKGRWGSCSAKKNISLNAALLCLPDFLVRHVLIHELTHLKHLNHSSHFWQDVALFDPDFKKNRWLLKQYTKDVPPWLTQQFDVGFDGALEEDI